MTTTLTDESFDTLLKEGKPLVVDFWAEWCGPCKTLKPIFAELAEANKDKATFATANIDDTSIAQKFSIRGIPTILFFDKGVVVQTSVGAKTLSQLQTAVDTAFK